MDMLKPENLAQGLVSMAPMMMGSPIPLPPGVEGPMQLGPNMLAKGLGGIGGAVGQGVVNKGTDAATSAMGLGGDQQQAPPAPPGVVARPPAPPPHPIAPTAFSTPSARRPVPAGGGAGGGGMAGMSLQQMMELKKRGLM